MTERTTIRLPEELLMRAKRKAAAEGRTLTALIEEGLRQIVAERPEKTKPNAVRLPVSSATGGLMPGIDLTDNASPQEIEDVEYADRLKRLQ